MKKRYLSVLLALSLSLNTMPTIAFAEDAADTPTKNESENPQSTANADEDTQTKSTPQSVVYTKKDYSETDSDGTKDKPYANFEDAVANVADGGTIYVLGTGYLNDENVNGLGSGAIYIIDKKITIQGMNEDGTNEAQAQLDIRRNGILLGKDVTINDINLLWSNGTTSAIFANGHSLTAKNVTLNSSGITVHLFAGSPNKNNITLPQNTSMPSAGSSAEIALTNCTFGNLYAGGMGESFGGNVVISLDENSKIDNIYGAGASSSVSNVDTSKGTSGKLTVTMDKVPAAFTSGTNLLVDGLGANSTVVSIAESSTQGRTVKLKDVATLKITAGYAVANYQESSSKMAIDLASGTKLKLADSGSTDLGALTGGGTLQIGTAESLSFDSVEGTHTLETISSSGSATTATQDATYITQTSGSGTFSLASGSAGINEVLELTKDGISWKITEKSNQTPTSTTVTSLAIPTENAVIAKTPTAINQEDGGAEVKVNFTGASYLTDVPITLTLKEDTLSDLTVPTGTADSSNDNSVVIRNFKLTISDVALDGTVAADGVAYILIEKNETDIPAGIYTFTISAPTASGSTVMDRFTLLVNEDGTVPAEKILTGIVVTTQPTKTQYTAGETFDPTGMVVTASYSDSSYKPLRDSDYSYSPTGTLQAGTASVTISYTEGGITQTTNLPIMVSTGIPTPVVKQNITKDMFDVTDPNLTYNEQDQSEALIGAVTVKDEYKDKLGTVTVTATHTSGKTGCTDSGEYKLTVSCTGGLSYNAVSDLEIGTVKINPMTVAIDTYPVFKDKTFDGSPNATLKTAPTFKNTADNAPLNLKENTDYTITGQFTESAVGSTVNWIITLRSDNYTTGKPAAPKEFAGTATTAKIEKAAAPTNLTGIALNHKASGNLPLTIDFSQYQNVVGIPANAGDIGTISVKNGYDTSKFTVTAAEKTLTIDKPTDADWKVGDELIFTILVSTQNYEDAEVPVTITLTEKAVPTVSANDISVEYNGAPLSADLIQGTATFNGNAVEGTWSWSETAPTAVADSGTKTVTFTPKDSDTYASVDTTVKVTIRQAKLSGNPSYTPIETSGKTLADANLTANPNWTSGTLKWNDSTDTVVTQDKGYRWTFTPNDANYEYLQGSITPWQSKDVPAVSVNDISVEYNGAPLSADLIQGKATYGASTLEGTWSWSGTAPQNVADSGQVGVTFTPTDSDTYASVDTTINVTIRQATLSGEPTYTKITTSGKTLADANLTANPNWTSGTLAWVKNETTEVTQGTGYHWSFTPNDTNYKTREGEIILWEKSTNNNHSGGSGGSSSAGSTASNTKNDATSGSESNTTPVTVPVSSAHDSVEIAASVSESTASVDINQTQIDTIISSGETNVTVDISHLENVDSAKLPADIITAANQASEIGVTVALPTGSVMLDEQALSSIADGKDVTVSVETVTPAALTDAQKAAIGDQAETALVVDVNVLVGTEKRSSFGDGTLTISVPYTLKDGEDAANLTVWFIHDDGTIENMGGSYDAEKKCFTFETKHLSKYVLMSLPETENTSAAGTQNPAGQAKSFVDVPTDAYYADAVAWASANGIASGVGDALFAPNRSCTRAQVVTFFWRFAGKPAAAQATAFGDVESGAYYSNAIRWAAEQSIVSGYPNGLFGTNDTITREQMVTFLYRFAKSNGMDTTQGGMAVREFSDYESISGYARNAMQWAVNSGILKGTNGYLMPDAPCTRAEIISLLYRLQNLDSE